MQHGVCYEPVPPGKLFRIIVDGRISLWYPDYCEERHWQMTNWKISPQVLWKPSGKESVLQYVIQSRSNAETGNLTRTHALLSNGKINSVFTSDKDVRRFCSCLVIYKTMDLSVPTPKLIFWKKNNY